MCKCVQPWGVVDQAGDDGLGDGGQDPGEDGHQGGGYTELQSCAVNWMECCTSVQNRVTASLDNHVILYDR